MSFQITKIEKSYFPARENVIASLDKFNISDENIFDVIRNFICDESLIKGYGYQQSIAQKLEGELLNCLCSRFNLYSANIEYSENLNEKADLAIEREKNGKRIFFELEFRPNVEKDLMKFQIGYNSNKLEIAILIVALKRNEINPSYTTMPEYEKIKRLILELAPKYSLLLIGITGKHL